MANVRHLKYFELVCFGSAVVSVMDSHSCDRGSIPCQGNHRYVILLNNIHFISDESSAELVLY